MRPDVDVAIVGARCAGATLAALLAPAGLRVLLCDRAAFPSPTVSTHTMHADALAVLADVGVLPDVERLGAPRIQEVVCDYGDFRIVGAPPPVAGIDHGLCVPRERLDRALLVHAARRGADVAERTRAVDLVIDGGRVAGVVLEGPSGRAAVRAGVVVGADGRTSTVARLTRAAVRHTQRSGWYLWFGIFAGVAPRRPAAYEMFFESASFFYLFPTCGGLHVLGGEFAFAEHPPHSGDGAAGLLQLIRQHPGFSERVAGARLVDGPYGLFRIDSFTRAAGGPGWALVGDAAFFKDPCTGQGMYDAFRAARLLAGRLTAAGGGPDGWLDGYEADREREFAEWYRFTCRAAQALPVSPERRRLLRHVARDPGLTRAYLGIQNHASRPSEVFTKELVRSVLAPAGRPREEEV